MKTIRKKASLLIAAVISVTLLTGCGTKNESSADSGNSTTKVITDMEGRQVTIPKTVNKVISLSNNTTVDIYALSPDKLLGLSFQLKDAAKGYIPDKYFNLPVVGTTTDGKVDNEAILKLAPDIIVTSDEDEVFNADEIQNQLNIPVVMISTDMTKIPEEYTLLGECLGEQDRAKELSDLAKKTLDNVKTQVAKVPDDKKPSLYYSENTGLKTDISGNVHTQVMDYVGAKNVADIQEDKIGSMADVSMEQVLKWNPQFILVGKTTIDLYSQIMTDPNWSKIQAVKEKKVYQIPSLPFNWVDRPPSSTRALGAEWLASVLYPDYVKFDVKSDTKEFYKKFFRIDLTDDQLNTVMKNAMK